MSDPTARSRRVTAAALLGAGAVAGVIGAAAFTANAATSRNSSSSATSTTSAASAAPSGAPARNGPGRPGSHGFGGQNPDEAVVTGAKAATLRAAALAHVSGGTVTKIETDSGDAAYEVHMTNSSGQPVTVKFDKDLQFVNVEDGMGK